MIATYYRPEAHHHGERHTCPVCLRAIKTTKRGAISRHGWSESGRVGGSFGNGYQWGSCNGSGSTPIEVSDWHALHHRTGIMGAASRANDAAKVYAAHGPDTLTCGVHVSIPLGPRPRHDADVEAATADLMSRDAVKAACAAGVAFKVALMQERSYWRWVVTATVPRGYVSPSPYGLRVRSYAEEARVAAADLRDQSAALYRQADAILAAITKVSGLTDLDGLRWCYDTQGAEDAGQLAGRMPGGLDLLGANWLQPWARNVWDAEAKRVAAGLPGRLKRALVGGSFMESVLQELDAQ